MVDPMTEINDLLHQAKALQQRLTTVAEQLNLSGMQTKLHTLEIEMAQPEFWQNQSHAQAVSKSVNELRSELTTWKTLQHDLENIEELGQLAVAEADHSLVADLAEKFTDCETQFAKLEFHLLLNGPYDDYPTLVAIHAGAGGVDAQDWAEILLRMMLRYCEIRGFSTHMLDSSRGNEAGIKSAVFEVTGHYAFGYLKSEHGVHRLVRQSPFNADALRQTSFALIEVLPDLGEMSPVVIDPEDLKIDVYRSGGKGGQSVNTTDSAVRITHLPTNIVVTCQNERSQHQNKETAMKILRAKLNVVEIAKQQAEKLKLRGEYTSAEWGNQIRSYVLHPYKMVKDHRTEYEESDPSNVLDGHLDGFVEAYLRSTITARVSNDDIK